MREPASSGMRATATGERRPAGGGGGKEAGTTARSGCRRGRGRLETPVLHMWSSFAISPPCLQEATLQTYGIKY